MQHRDPLNRHQRLLKSVFLLLFLRVCLKLIKKKYSQKGSNSAKKTQRKDGAVVFFSAKLRKFEAQGFKQPEITEGCDFIKSRKGLFDETARI